MNKSVYLSPSTQEKNIGYGTYGTEERRMNEVADVAEIVLKQHGVIVYRNEPECTLQQVVADSNSKKPDLHFAIHSNAGGSRGCEVFAYAPGGEGEKAARAVYSELAPLTPTSDRGVKFNPGLYELRKTTAPAVLVEVAFHDNPEDAGWIISHIEAIGTALAKGILKYFDIPYREVGQNLDRALKTLQEFGILESPEYWRKNAVKGKTVAGEYAGILIQRVAALLLKNF